jgi:hypothetical protein
MRSEFNLRQRADEYLDLPAPEDEDEDEAMRMQVAGALDLITSAVALVRTALDPEVSDPALSVGGGEPDVKPNPMCRSSFGEDDPDFDSWPSASTDEALCPAHGLPRRMCEIGHQEAKAERCGGEDCADFSKEHTARMHTEPAAVVYDLEHGTDEQGPYIKTMPHGGTDDTGRAYVQGYEDAQLDAKEHSALVMRATYEAAVKVGRAIHEGLVALESLKCCTGHDDECVFGADELCGKRTVNTHRQAIGLDPL